MRLPNRLLTGLLFIFGAIALVLGPPAVTAQLERYPPDSPFPKQDDEGVRLPNGKLQRDVILKHEHERSLKELQEIHRISGELVEEFEKNTEFVLSLKTLKKLEKIEELSRDVRKRVKK